MVQHDAGAWALSTNAVMGIASHEWFRTSAVYSALIAVKAPRRRAAGIESYPEHLKYQNRSESLIQHLAGRQDLSPRG